MTCKQMSGVGFPETGLTKPDFRSDITYNLTLWTCVLYYHPICYHLLTSNQFSQWRDYIHINALMGKQWNWKVPVTWWHYSHFSLCKWCWNSHKITPQSIGKTWACTWRAERELRYLAVLLFLIPLIQESLTELGAGLVDSQAPGTYCLHLSTGLQVYT